MVDYRALQAYIFPGLTGAHKIELIYVNAWPGLPKFLSQDVNIAKVSTSENPRSLKSARFSPRGGRDRGKFRNVAPGRSPSASTRCRGVGFRGRPTFCLRLATGMSREM